MTGPDRADRSDGVASEGAPSDNDGTQVSDTAEAADGPAAEPGAGSADGSGSADYRRLVEGLSTHAIVGLDRDGRVTTWTAPAWALYGFDAAAVRGERVDTLFAADADPDRPLADVLAAARDGTATTECWHRRADGSVFWGTLTLAPLREGDTVVGFSAVSQDTTDRKQRERMLERQNDRLKEFTDVLAHDLRTPLNVIDGRLDLYEETGDREHVDAVAATAERMERLVDDLLGVARQGNVVTDPEPVDVAALVERAWDGTPAADGGATLVSERVGAVSADPDRLCRLFENLFRNAVEHGDPEVTVTVGPMDRGFYVADDGPGIPEPRRDAVFDHGVSTSDDGTGYGLSIVRTIANAHGWDVVATESADGGARFEVTGIDPIE